MSVEHLIKTVQDDIERSYKELEGVKRQQLAESPLKSERLLTEERQLKGFIASRTKSLDQLLKQQDAVNKALVERDGPNLREKIRDRERMADYLRRHELTPEKHAFGSERIAQLDQQILRDRHFPLMERQNPRLAAYYRGNVRDIQEREVREKETRTSFLSSWESRIAGYDMAIQEKEAKAPPAPAPAEEREERRGGLLQRLRGERRTSRDTKTKKKDRERDD